MIEKTKGFVPVPNIVLYKFGLSPYELAVYVVIYSHANRETLIAYPRIETIAAVAHISRTTVMNCTKTLEKKGLITVKRNTPDRYRKAVNIYKITKEDKLLTLANMVAETDLSRLSQRPELVSENDTNKNQLNKNQNNNIYADGHQRGDILNLSDEDKTLIHTETAFPSNQEEFSNNHPPPSPPPKAELTASNVDAQPKKDKKAMMHGEFYEAYFANIIEAFGWNRTQMPQSALSLVGSVAKEFANIPEAMNPDEIFKLYNYCEVRFANLGFSPKALAKFAPDYFALRERQEQEKYITDEGYECWYYDEENGLREWFDHRGDLQRDIIKDDGKLKILTLFADQFDMDEVIERRERQRKSLK